MHLLEDDMPYPLLAQKTAGALEHSQFMTLNIDLQHIYGRALLRQSVVESGCFNFFRFDRQITAPGLIQGSSPVIG